MRGITLLFLWSALHLPAQTTVYLRMGPPAVVNITNSTHGTPPTITTQTPHNFSVGDVIGNWAVCTGAMFDPSAGQSPVNGLHKVLSVPTATTFTIGDLAGNPIADSGDFVTCAASATHAGTTPWAAKYTAVTLPAGPFGWLDGQTGPWTRKLALGTANGLVSLVVSGCPSACVVTLTTNYDHGISANDYFAISGTASSQLNTAGSGAAHTPWQAASVTSNTVVSKPIRISGLTNQDYTYNNACFDPAKDTPNDTSAGTGNCVRVSQLAYTGNTMWDQLMASTTALYGSGCPNCYLFPLDNPTTGNFPHTYDYETGLLYSLSAVRWFVDPTDTQSFTVAIYALQHIEQMFAVTWPCYADAGAQACGVGSGGLQGDADEMWAGISFLANIIVPAMAPASVTTLANKLYNDVDVAGNGITTANVDTSRDRRNKIIATGRAQGGSATSITLSADDPASTADYYKNNVVHLYYATPIVSFAPAGSGEATTITTASNWGYNGNIPASNSIVLYISGVTGCTVMNTVWTYVTPLDSTHFVLPYDSRACNPGGGTIVSYDITCTGYVTCSGLITGYDPVTKTATLSGWNGQPITSDMSYKIFETVSINNQTGQKAATITGYNTHFSTELKVGDAVYGSNAFVLSNGPWIQMSYVTGPTSDGVHITSDTTLNVLNMNNPVTSSTPSMAWFISAWTPTDPGFKWYGEHWQGAIGVAPVLYPPSGGTAGACVTGPCPGGNNDILFSFARAGVAMALAPYDARAVKDLALAWNYASDFEASHYFGYISGAAHSGAVYSLGNIYGIGFMASKLFPSIPSFPALDTTWARQTALYNIYSLLPDLDWNGTDPVTAGMPPSPTPVPYGTNSSQGYVQYGTPTAQAYTLNPSLAVAPTSNESKYLAYLLNQYGLWSGPDIHRIYYDGIALLLNDPRTLSGAMDYSTLPTQRAFLQSSNDSCIAMGGFPCPNASKSYLYISRTGWTNPLTMTGRASTFTYFGSRSFTGFKDHDIPQCGSTWIYKVGGLIGSDASFSMQAGVASENGNTVKFGNSITNLMMGIDGTLMNGQVPFGYCPITQWASQNHGSYDPQYGDQNSRYAYACSDMTGMYVPGTMNWGRTCTADLKNTSLNGGTGEQVVVQGTFIDTHTTPTAVEAHIHYNQNGQSADMSEGGVGLTYPEGLTTCPGGCANLNTSRTIQSLEDGAGPITVSIASLTPGYPTIVQTSGPSGAVLKQYGKVSGVNGSGICNGTAQVIAIADSTHITLDMDTTSCVSPKGGTWLNDFNPARTYGVVSNFFSPGTVTVRDDSYPVTISSITPGNPTVFYAPANGIVTSSAWSIASITMGNPTVIQTSIANPFKMYDQIGIVGVSGCAGLNTTLHNQIAIPVDSTHTYVYNGDGSYVDATGCSNPSGGYVFYWPHPNVKIIKATGAWAGINTDYSCPTCLTAPSGDPAGVVPITWIDVDHFSVPFDSTGLDPAAFNGQIYAAYGYAMGYSHRVSICGGPICGNNTTGLEFVAAHKIAQNLSDTTFAATALNPDANWTGVQTKDKVVLMARGQFPQTAITNFTTTHSGTAQYLFGGVAAGSWDVKINGNEVAGSPFTVPNGDNSIYFESTAGTVVVTPTLQACALTDSSTLPGGTVGSAYSQTLHAAGCTAPLTWSLWSESGPICLGLSLDSSAGVIAGTPGAPQVCNFTVQVQDANSAVATEALQITVTNSPLLSLSPAALVFSCTSGGADPAGQNVTIGATGVTLNNWSAARTQSWLKLSPSSGAAAGNLTVSTSGCGGLAPGSYNDTITVSSTTSGITNSPQTVNVALSVKAAAGVATTPGGKVAVGGAAVIH